MIDVLCKARDSQVHAIVFVYKHTSIKAGFNAETAAVNVSVALSTAMNMPVNLLYASHDDMQVLFKGDDTAEVTQAIDDIMVMLQVTWANNARYGRMDFVALSHDNFNKCEADFVYTPVGVPMWTDSSSLNVIVKQFVTTGVVTRAVDTFPLERGHGWIDLACSGNDTLTLTGMVGEPNSKIIQPFDMVDKKALWTVFDGYTEDLCAMEFAKQRSYDRRSRRNHRMTKGMSLSVNKRTGIYTSVKYEIERQ